MSDIDLDSYIGTAVATPDGTIRIPRPPNSFLIYRMDQNKALKGTRGDKAGRQSDVSKEIGERWKNAPRDVTDKYKQLASRVQMRHRELFPHYRFKPGKGKEKKKKSRPSAHKDAGPQMPLPAMPALDNLPPGLFQGSRSSSISSSGASSMSGSEPSSGYTSPGPSTPGPVFSALGNPSNPSYGTPYGTRTAQDDNLMWMQRMKMACFAVSKLQNDSVLIRRHYHAQDDPKAWPLYAQHNRITLADIERVDQQYQAALRAQERIQQQGPFSRGVPVHTQALPPQVAPPSPQAAPSPPEAATSSPAQAAQSSQWDDSHAPLDAGFADFAAVRPASQVTPPPQAEQALPPQSNPQPPSPRPSCVQEQPAPPTADPHNPATPALGVIPGWDRREDEAPVNMAALGMLPSADAQVNNFAILPDFSELGDLAGTLLPDNIAMDDHYEPDYASFGAIASPVRNVQGYVSEAPSFTNEQARAGQHYAFRQFEAQYRAQMQAQQIAMAEASARTQNQGTGNPLETLPAHAIWPNDLTLDSPQAQAWFNVPNA